MTNPEAPSFDNVIDLESRRKGRLDEVFRDNRVEGAYEPTSRELLDPNWDPASLPLARDEAKTGGAVVGMFQKVSNPKDIKK